MKYRLQDLIDVRHFQELQDRLNEIYSFPSAIIDNDGNILTATAWQEICSRFHRSNSEAERICIESDQYIKDHLHEANPAVTYRCPHGLVDNATPIVIDGVHYGNFFTGQFFLEKPDLEFYRQRARKFGFDEAQYLEAVRKVPIWTEEQINSYLLFIKELITVISESGLAKLKEVENRKAIEKSEQYYRSIIKAALDGYWLTDIDGRILEVNDAYCRMSGYSEEELLGMHIADVEAEESPEMVAAHMRRLISSGSDRFLSRHRRKDGTVFDVEVSTQCRSGENGQYVCFLRDITQQKKAQEALRQERDYAQHLLDTVPAIIVMLDSQGSIQLINPKGCQMLGYDESELIGQNWFARFFPQADATGQAYRTFRRILAGEVEGSQYFENPVLTRSGELRHIAWHNTTIYDANGLVVGTLSAGEDITERKQLESTLLNAIDLAQLAIWEYDFLNDIFTFNDRFYKLFRTTVAQVGGYRMSSAEYAQRFVHPEDIALVAEEVRAAIETTDPNFKRQLDHRILYADGQVGYISVRFFIVKDAQGVTVRSYGVNQDITERTLAFDKVKRANERMQLAADAARFGIWDYHLAENQLEWDDWMFRLYGLERDAISSGYEAWQMGLHPEDRQRMHNEVELALLGKREFDSQFRIVRPDGETRVIRAHAKVTRDRHGQPVHMTGVNYDITDLVTAIEELKESEERFKALHNASFGGITIHDKGLILECKQGLSDITGYSYDELIGMNGLLLIAEESREEVMSNILAGYKKPYEVFGRRKNGTVYPLRLEARNIPRQGREVRVVEFRDITEHRRAEEALRKSQEEYRSLLQNIHVGVVVHAPDSKILFSNSSAAQLLGLTSDQLRGKTAIDEAWSFVREDGTRMPVEECPVNQVLATKTPITNVILGIVRPDRERPTWVQCNAHLDRAADGALQQIVVSFIDITDRKLAEEEKKILNAQLQQAQKLEAIGTLAGGIAHDFNNILGAIIGYAEMIRDDLPPQAPILHDIDQVIKASHRAKDLVKQILAFSRQVEDQKTPIQPAVIVKEAITLLRSSLPTTITIRQDIDPQAGTVLADPTQIHQIVMNLSTNAFHAMEAKGGTLTISLKKRMLSADDLAPGSDLQPGAFVQLSVRDTGAGILPEIRERIFDPFFTTKEVGKGTGLGLSMVYSIVAGCGGSISCDSRVGEGTEFRILLPALQDQGKQEKEATTVVPHGREHILFIDDEEVLVELGQAMLERLGYHVTTRTSRLDALTTFQNRPDAFDLVITDQTMPGMTGVDLARRILQIRPQMPIILCTGYSTLIGEDKAKALGIKGFAYKPLSKKDIGELIRKVLAGATL